MPRPLQTALLGGAVIGVGAFLGACRADTVTLGLAVEAGDEQHYRYEIEVEVVRALEGSEPETTNLVATVLADQTIVAVDATGATAEVTLRTHGGPTRTTEVRLDPSGLLSGLTLIEGQDLDVFGLESVAHMLPPMPLPQGPVTVGSRWPVDGGTATGSIRLDRLGVVDGEDVAFVTSDLAEVVDEVRPAADTTANLLGEVRSDTTIAFDLGDGTARRVHSTSVGELDAAIMPPVGVDAAPVAGTIRYTVRVEAVRLD